MNVYENLTFNNVINASGKMTVLCISKVSEDVANTMKEASQNFVIIDKLFDRVGKLISKIIGREDTCITSSASAGIVLSVTGVITGKNLTAIENLLQTDGVKK